MRFGPLAVPLFLAAALVFASPAGAANVAVDGDTLRVVASPGEVNAVTIHANPFGSTIDVSDSGAPDTMVAGSRCAPTGAPGAVSCETAGVARMSLDLGDGDDHATMETILPVHLAGGDGNDVLYGGFGDDLLETGPGDDLGIGDQGNDRVLGDVGRDTLDGGPGDDSLEVRDRKADEVVCGTGRRDFARAEVLDELDIACERVDYGPAGRVGRLRTITGGGRFVRIPGQFGARIDRRILPNVLYLIRRYKVRVGDGFATSGHSPRGEHPLGLAVDLYPGPGGSWRLVGKLARWAEPRQNRPRFPFRWVGYNGDFNHGDPWHCRPSRGCPPHLHLSWDHSPGRFGRPVRTVWAFLVRGAAASAAGARSTGPGGLPRFPTHSAGPPDW
ncbi:MAG TPA: calcium-binding protein [Thermoleophilaceae bacterium]|nr:calcium-binding protein [Thermoleophilaceae bacterium]